MNYVNDANETDTAVAISPKGSMLAVRFTPPQQAALVSARFYIKAKPAQFNVRILDSNRRLLSQRWLVNPAKTGWVSQDISDGSLTFSTDFYVAVEYLTSAVSGYYGFSEPNSPQLGAVDGNPSGRNYDIFYDQGNLEWRPDPSVPNYRIDHSYMIEVTLATEALLKVTSPVDGTTGAGCYNLGATVQVSTPSMITPEVGTREVFVSWNGDISGTENPTNLELTKWVTSVNANYKTQYYLAVNSPVFVAASGWYDAGSIATLSTDRIMPAPFPLGQLGAHYVFMEWSGDVTGNSPTETVIMNKPQSVIAIWSVDYSGMYISLIILAVIGFAGIYAAMKVVGRKHRSGRRKTNAAFRSSQIDRDEGNRVGPAQYLARLTNLRVSGQITEEVYEKLKTEYEMILKES